MLTLADRHLLPIADAELLAWARGYDANEVAIEDNRIANACHRAMRAPIHPGCEIGYPLARQAAADTEAIPLPMALDRWGTSYFPDCDCCREERHSENKLVIPRGASWLLVHVCWDCRDELDGSFGSLVWG